MTDKLLTAEQIDELELRVANWMEADDDFDADSLVVDAVLNLLPLAIAELRAARATGFQPATFCDNQALHEGQRQGHYG